MRASDHHIVRCWKIKGLSDGDVHLEGFRILLCKILRPWHFHILSPDMSWFEKGELNIIFFFPYIMEVEDGPTVHATPLGCTHYPRAEGNQVSIPIGARNFWTNLSMKITFWWSLTQTHSFVLTWNEDSSPQSEKDLIPSDLGGHVLFKLRVPSEISNNTRQSMSTTDDILSDMIKWMVTHWMSLGTSFSCKHLQWQSEWEHEWEWMNHHLTFQLLTLHSLSTSPLKDHPHPHHPPRRHPRLGSSVSESDSLKMTSNIFLLAAWFFKPHLQKKIHVTVIF